MKEATHRIPHDEKHPETNRKEKRPMTPTIPADDDADNPPMTTTGTGSMIN